MLKELGIAIVGGSIAALGGYLLLVTENKTDIKHIEKQLAEIKAIAKENGQSLISTKLFVAQAHPDRDSSSLVSLEKLSFFENADVIKLAETIAQYDEDSETIEKLRLKLVNSDDIAHLKQKYNLEVADINTYVDIAKSPAFSHSG